MTFLDVLKAVTTVLGLLIGLCYAYQILYLFVPFVVKKNLPQHNVPHRYAILIAARNEELVLPHLLESIQKQTYPTQLITTYVIADNCTDNTAQVAEQGGAVVFSRFDTSKVGKGYALNYLLDKIEHTAGLDSYDAFLVFDADNLLSPDYIEKINALPSTGYDVFCGFRNSKNFGTNWVSAGHAVWYLHDSIHLNHSRMLLGVPCSVTGTGFGFTRQLLKACGGWRFFTLTEDVEFNTWCAIHGVRAGYCHDAVLFDEQPETLRQSWRQRTRWVQGGIQVSLRYGTELLRGICRGGKTGYACLEATSLSLWGYGVSAFCAMGSLMVTFLSAGWLGFGKALLFALLGTVLIPTGIGAMTIFTQWNRIRASTGQKMLGLFAFPLHALTYIPIAVSAVFRKFHWPPIEHKVAVSARELCGK